MNKVMIVTGGSRGIGAATSILAASQGYSVCVNYIQDANSANNVVSKIKQSGGNANITSYFLCAREAVKRMSTQYGGKGGAIVNVSSAASRLGSAGEYIDYAASKGAIDTLTIGLSREVANEHIRVNCVRPGFIHTDIHISSGDPDRINRVSPSLPMRRGGQPSEIANAIMWLISDESSYITGTFIDAAGGYNNT